MLLDIPGNIWRWDSSCTEAISEVYGSSQTDGITATFSYFKPDVRLFRNHRNIHSHSSLLNERRSWDRLQVAYHIFVPWISLLFLLRRDVLVERKYSYTKLWFECAVIGALQVLLDSPDHIRGRNGSRRGAISKAHVSCRTDQAIAPCNSLKPDVRMFRTYGNIHTHLSLLDEWSSQDSPTNSRSCRVFFYSFSIALGCFGWAGTAVRYHVLWVRYHQHPPGTFGQSRPYLKVRIFT